MYSHYDSFAVIKAIITTVVFATPYSIVVVDIYVP